MTYGYDKKLYILAFDHRGSFQKKFFGIEGEPGRRADGDHRRRQAPDLRGPLQAVARRRRTRSHRRARRRAVRLDRARGGPRAGPQARDARRAIGQHTFDFEYGDDFGEHIESFDPDFTKVLVRYNPDGDPRPTASSSSEAQAPERLAARPRAASSCSSCSCPPRTTSSSSVGGDTDRYDAELRPELMRRAIEEIQDCGIEADVWKIEGVDAPRGLRDARRTGTLRRPRRCRLRAARPRRRRRQGRPLADQAAPVDGFIGFAIGRSIWWDPLKAYVDGKIERAAGARSRSRTTTCASSPSTSAPSRRTLPIARSGRSNEMKMRQSLAELERAIRREVSLDRRRRDSLTPHAEKRTRKREAERRNKRGSVRFALLVADARSYRRDRHRR